MPLSFERDDARRCIVMTAMGTMTMDEWAACLADQIREGLWGYATLYDFRVAQSLPSGLPSVVRDVDELTRERGPRGPVAIVVSSAALHDHVRKYAALADALPFRIEIFNDIGVAEDWLCRNEL